MSWCCRAGRHSEWTRRSRVFRPDRQTISIQRVQRKQQTQSHATLLQVLPSLAWLGSGSKNDVGTAGPVAGGAVAFRLVGIITGLAVRSHSTAILMSAYGDTRSIYMNFFRRGHDISFPRDT